MCNRARNKAAPEPRTMFGGLDWVTERPMDNRFDPVELFPRSRAWVVREDEQGRGADVMTWDVAAGQAKAPMTNVRNLGLSQWRALAEDPRHRCLVPVTEFCEWTPEVHSIGKGRPIKGEMWFAVRGEPLFAIAGFWRNVGGARFFAMVTCPPNQLVEPVHPKAMVTILHRDDHDRWLRGGYDDVVALQRPYSAERMTVRGPEFPTRSAV